MNQQSENTNSPRKFEMPLVALADAESHVNLEFVLSGEVLPALGFVPAVIISGSPWSGKTTLARAIIEYLYGGRVCSSSLPKRQTGLDPIFYASRDKSYILFEDVHGKRLTYDGLHAFISSPVWEGRVPYKTEKYTIDTSKCRVFITGNDLDVPEDLLRRSVIIRLGSNPAFGRRLAA